MESRLVTIAAFNMPHQAHLAKARLEAEGIPAFIRDEHLVSMNAFLSPALGGVRVQVPEEFVAQAKEIIFTDHSDELSQVFEKDPPILCPKCDSESTFLLLGEPVIAIISFLLAGLPLIFLRNKQKCNTCGHLFKAPPSTPPENLTQA